MPEDHQKYLEWNGDRFRRWAKQIGDNTYKVVDAILTSRIVEQQSYRSLMGLLKLTEKYSSEALEAACIKALTYTAAPSFKSIKNILAAGGYKSKPEKNTESTTKSKRGISRGARYYGGKRI
jgi:hypothetical protein